MKQFFHSPLSLVISRDWKRWKETFSYLIETPMIKKRKNSERGITLLDLLATLILSAVISSFGIPQLANLTKTFDRFNARSNLLQDLKRAQAETIMEGCRGIVSIAADGKSYSFGCDYLSYDTDPVPSPDDVRISRILPANVTITASGNIIFDSRGQSVDENYVLQNVTISLNGSEGAFASGTILGTGVFTYE